MEENRLKYLLETYHKNACTFEELRELNSWYHSLNYHDQDFDSWAKDKEGFYSDFQNRLDAKNKRNNIRRLTAYAAAAAVLLLFSSVGLWQFFLKQESVTEIVKTQPEIISPGGNKAFLTLADGTKISLTDATKGEIAKQAGVQITKAKDGQLIYKALSVSVGSTEIPSNTIETPRGGQYQVLLPDGSKVWLNAASSLTYPTRFKGSTRTVKLNGEGYFEIAHNEKMPFQVVCNGQTVEVLGTHFNINTYSDEPSVKTTLLEGSVKVLATGGSPKILKPGQQSEINEQHEILVSNVDAKTAVAWKDGIFKFRNEPIESVMRKVSRWYNVDIVYQDGIPGKTVWGTISRLNTISEILELIELTKVAHFKIEGRRIIVMQ
ncbi:MAG TPA: FecR domain-containing protein [Sphingobacteriaceae bacterium]